MLSSWTTSGITEKGDFFFHPSCIPTWMPQAMLRSRVLLRSIISLLCVPLLFSMLKLTVLPALSWKKTSNEMYFHFSPVSWSWLLVHVLPDVFLLSLWLQQLWKSALQCLPLWDEGPTFRKLLQNHLVQCSFQHATWMQEQDFNVWHLHSKAKSWEVLSYVYMWLFGISLCHLMLFFWCGTLRCLVWIH